MRHDSHRTTSPRPGFTMMEIIVALSISTAVMLGVVSLLSLASSAVPQPGGIQETAVDGADLLARMSSDIACATQITQADAAAVTLIVPDRTGDDIAETISYSWGAGIGDPITRKVNTRGAVVMLDGATSLQFSYTAADVVVYEPITDSTSTVQEHQNAQDLGLAFTQAIQKDWFLQVIAPILPDTATGWTLDTIDVALSQLGKVKGVLRCEVRGLDDAFNPTDTVYASIDVDEALLSADDAAWTFALGGVELSPSEQVCFVISILGDRDSAYIGLAETAVWPSTAPYRISYDDGATWVTSTSEVVRHRVAGRILERTGGRKIRTAIGSIEVAIQAGSESWSTEMNILPVNAIDASAVAAGIPGP